MTAASPGLLDKMDNSFLSFDTSFHHNNHGNNHPANHFAPATAIVCQPYLDETTSGDSHLTAFNSKASSARFEMCKVLPTHFGGCGCIREADDKERQQVFRCKDGTNPRLPCVALVRIEEDRSNWVCPKHLRELYKACLQFFPQN